MRTNTDHSIPHRLRNPQRPESPSADGLAPLHSDFFPRQAGQSFDAWKDRKKGVSFLGRLSMAGRGWKKDVGDYLDSDSELGTDGASARVFSQAIAAPGAGGGYVPRHKEPPRYIRTKAYNKKVREFDHMFLAQELVGTRPTSTRAGESVDASSEGTAKQDGTGSSIRSGITRARQQTGGPIWSTEFSKDGRYLAAGGRDAVVRIWAVISTAEERKAQEDEELANGASGERLSAPVFMEKPVREFEGHTGEILDLTWSKNNFLLSSSMDKTVRLWHISRSECLCTFKHKDFVTRLAFHPRDDRFFLAGSLDTMLRLWSIPDKAIAYSAQLPDLVTAVAFSPDGKTAIAGLLNGLCLFYETEGLKFLTQIHVRSSRGKNAKGSKISGISTMTASPHFSTTSSQGTVTGRLPSRSSSDLAGDVKILITSNDSRIRVYNMRDKSLEYKLKGHENMCSQIAARFSDDGRYIICGSEDRKAFIWNATASGVDENRDKKPYEYFTAHPDIVTTAVFAPSKTRILLNGGGDPIFELCNPPPVTLMSLQEAASANASQVALSTAGDVAAGVEPPSDSAGVPPTPRKPDESPAYIARSSHYDGNIIVTTDATGIIKVFRQDCAFTKRKADNWETASSTFGRRQSQSIGGGFSVGGPGLGRSASILTRTSAGSAAHSRRGSLSQMGPPSAISSPHLGGYNGGSSDRILSWRQDIEGTGGKRQASSILSSAGGSPAVQARKDDRSISPSKSGRAPLGSSASEARKQQYANSPSLSKPGAGSLASPTSSTYGSIAGDPASKEKQKQKEVKEKERGGLPTPSFSFVPAGEQDDGLNLDPAGASHSFWNLNRWRNMAMRNNSSNQNTGLRPTDGSSPRSRSAVRKTDQSGPVSPGSDDDGSRRKSIDSPTHPLSPLNPSMDRRRRTLPPSSFLSAAVQSPPIPSIQLPDADAWQGDGGEGIYSRGNSIASKLTSELNFEREHVREEDEEVEEEEDDDDIEGKRYGGRELKATGVENLEYE
jgi:WD40 repeat protein